MDPSDLSDDTCQTCVNPHMFRSDTHIQMHHSCFSDVKVVNIRVVLLILQQVMNVFMTRYLIRAGPADHSVLQLVWAQS